jgi:four helix bundle protein
MVLRANAGRLLVHQIAAQVTRDAGELTKSLRGPAALPRGDQLVRAAGAVVASIGKACGRDSVAEFRRQIIYASGSAHELRSQLLIARLLDPTQAARCLALESRVTLVIKMLGRLHEHPPPEAGQ